jgi:hypothetical protein
MCIDCLKKNLSSIEAYANEVNGYLTNIDCECCKSFPSFLLNVNEDLKILCLTKIRRKEEICLNDNRSLMSFEVMIKTKIKHKLNCALEQLDDCSHLLKEQQYISRMGELKALNDFMDILDEADHR